MIDEIIVMLCFVCMLGLLLFDGYDSQTIEEKETICKKECDFDGWDNGVFAGHGFCHCYNVSLNIKDSEKEK